MKGGQKHEPGRGFGYVTGNCSKQSTICTGTSSGHPLGTSTSSAHASHARPTAPTTASSAAKSTTSTTANALQPARSTTIPSERACSGGVGGDAKRCRAWPCGTAAIDVTLSTTSASCAAAGPTSTRESATPSARLGSRASGSVDTAGGAGEEADCRRNVDGCNTCTGGPAGNSFGTHCTQRKGGTDLHGGTCHHTCPPGYMTEPGVNPRSQYNRVCILELPASDCLASRDHCLRCDGYDPAWATMEADEGSGGSDDTHPIPYYRGWHGAECMTCRDAWYLHERVTVCRKLPPGHPRRRQRGLQSRLLGLTRSSGLVSDPKHTYALHGSDRTARAGPQQRRCAATRLRRASYAGLCNLLASA